MQRPLRLYRDAFLSQEDAQRIHEVALGILQEAGLLVADEGVRGAMARAGFALRGKRVTFEPRVVEEHVAEHRRRLAARTPEPDEGDGRLTLGVSSYNHHLLDPDSGEIVPFTSERLIAMTRFVDTLAERGVYGSTPGYPSDVPPELQPLAQYRIGAEHSRQGGAFNDISVPWVMDYVMAMAEVMGRPVREMPVYLVSPLHLGGTSLEIALHFRDRLERIHVSGMPAAGATAPIEPFGALALAAAEAMGSYVTLAVTTGLEVGFSVWVFPFDLRAMTMVFGSPENWLLRALAGDLNRYYGHRLDRHQGLGDIYAMAKEVGSQAAAEKASLMTAAALLGERSFGGAGSLSMDDLFSPLQLLVDCEIRDHTQRLADGLSIEDREEGWVSIVREGIAHGFMGLDSTLDSYRRLYWYPQLFDRSSLGAWLAAGSPHLLDRVREVYRRQLAGHAYELDATRRGELQRIWEAALAQAH